MFPGILTHLTDVDHLLPIGQGDFVTAATAQFGPTTRDVDLALNMLKHGTGSSWRLVPSHIIPAALLASRSGMFCHGEGSASDWTPKAV